MVLVHKKVQGNPQWEFIMTDSYNFKPGKIINNVTLSQYKQNEEAEGIN